jgi:AAA domain, putative AbiEii toxin, Type IV TA system/AAA domain
MLRSVQGSRTYLPLPISGDAQLTPGLIARAEPSLPIRCYCTDLYVVTKVEYVRAVINTLRLKHFKAFEDFTVRFPEDAILLGPNNAGKSTVIAALRAAASMARTASRRKAVASRQIDGTKRTGHIFSGESVGLIEENLRYEFHEIETKLSIEFAGDGRIDAIWPVEEEAFFYVLDNDINLTEPRHVRSTLPSVGLVPVLSPVEHVEMLLSDKHVSANLETSLASRHFRNQLYQLDRTYGNGKSFRDFKRFAQPWVSEFEIADLRLQHGEGGSAFDLFYVEDGSQKEIFWAGDGMQIWIQLLLHLYRLRDMDIIVLDEPDVFLHSDLQRRLIRLLEELPAQTITATHSAEVVGEGSDSSIVWISRDRRKAVRSPKRESLVDLSEELGTQFNLRLARALKTKTVLFVEGDDIKIISRLARTLGFEDIHRERGVAVIPLGGFDRWEHVEPFRWLMSEFFEDAAVVHVILDRDYRVEEAIERVRRRLRQSNIAPHVWRRKEIENYLLNPACIARVTGASEAWVEESLPACANELEDEVYAQILAEHARHHGGGKLASATVTKEAKKHADAIWKDPSRRLHACGGKELLSRLNARLQGAGHKATSARRLARSLRSEEIPDEVKSVLESIER